MSAISRLAIPRRKRVFRDEVLPNGDRLPFWSTLDLDEKLPVVPSPRGSYTLYTTSVGQPKYSNKQKYDFDLTDPLCHVQSLEYDSLHDPFLKHHFQQKSIKRHLVKIGLLTEDERVICSLKEFNSFRNYMRYRRTTELSLKRGRDRTENTSIPRRIQSERTERNTDSSVGSENGTRDTCLIDEIRKRETEALIRRERLKREKQDRNQQKIIEDWENRKVRQEQKLKRNGELLESGRKKREANINEKDNWGEKQRIKSETSQE